MSRSTSTVVGNVVDTWDRDAGSMKGICAIDPPPGDLPATLGELRS